MSEVLEPRDADTQETELQAGVHFPTQETAGGAEDVGCVVDGCTRGLLAGEGGEIGQTELNGDGLASEPLFLEAGAHLVG